MKEKQHENRLKDILFAETVKAYQEYQKLTRYQSEIPTIRSYEMETSFYTLYDIIGKAGLGIEYQTYKRRHGLDFDGMPLDG